MLIVIGIFEIESLGMKPGSGPRWRCRNTATGYVHVTYGSEEEVVEQLKAQSEAWKRRLAGHRFVSYAWRNTNRADANRAMAKKASKDE